MSLPSMWVWGLGQVPTLGGCGGVAPSPTGSSSSSGKSQVELESDWFVQSLYLPGEEKIIITIIIKKKNKPTNQSPQPRVVFLKGVAGEGLGQPPLCSGAVARLEPALGLNYSVAFREDKWGLERDTNKHISHCDGDGVDGCSWRGWTEHC